MNGVAHFNVRRLAYACVVLMCGGCSASTDAEQALWEGLNDAIKPAHGEALKLVSPLLNIPENPDNGDVERDALKKQLYQYFEKTFLDGEDISVDIGEPGELSLVERYEATTNNRTLLQDKACFVVLDDTAYEEGLSGPPVFTKYDRVNVFRPRVWNLGSDAAPSETKAVAEGQSRWQKHRAEQKESLGSECFMCDESPQSIGDKEVHPGFIPPVLVDMFDMMSVCNDEDDEISVSTCVQEAFKDRVPPEEQDHLIAKVVSVLDCTLTVVQWPIARMGLTPDVLLALEASNTNSAPYSFVNKVLTAFVKAPCPALGVQAKPKLYLMGLLLKTVQGSTENQEKADRKLLSDLGFGKVHEPNKDGDYVLHRAVTEQQGVRSEGDLKKLIQMKADVEARDRQGATPLLRAMQNKSHGFMLYLMLEARANVSAVDNHSQGALDYAARYTNKQQGRDAEAARLKLYKRLLETLTGDELEKAAQRIEEQYFMMVGVEVGAKVLSKKYGFRDDLAKRGRNQTMGELLKKR